MYNTDFKSLSVSNKYSKLVKILKSKHPCPSDLHIHRIIKAIDVNRQYTIHVTSKIEKFKNIIVHEYIETSTKSVRSITTPIYGSFSCGMFQNVNGLINKKASNCSIHSPAAAIKEVLDLNSDNSRRTYHLVVYVPPRIQLIK